MRSKNDRGPDASEVRRFIHENPHSKTKDIAEHFKKSSPTISPRLKELVADGDVCFSRHPNGGKAWRVVDTPPPVFLKKSRILDYIQNNPGSHSSDIYNYFRTAQSNFSRLAKELEGEGHITFKQLSEGKFWFPAGYVVRSESAFGSINKANLNPMLTRKWV